MLSWGWQMGASLCRMVPVRTSPQWSPVSCHNIIGMGLGPQGVGILSDYFAADYGAESLRYSLLIFGCVNVWSAWHYYLAGRTLQVDMAQFSTATPATGQAQAAGT